MDRNTQALFSYHAKRDRIQHSIPSSENRLLEGKALRPKEESWPDHLVKWLVKSYSLLAFGHIQITPLRFSMMSVFFVKGPSHTL